MEIIYLLKYIIILLNYIIFYTDLTENLLICDVY